MVLYIMIMVSFSIKKRKVSLVADSGCCARELAAGPMFSGLQWPWLGQSHRVAPTHLVVWPLAQVAAIQAICFGGEVHAKTIHVMKWSWFERKC